MNKSYHIAEQADSETLVRFMAKEGQFLLPMVQLIEQAEVAVDEVIEVMGRATIEAVLLMSAEQVARASSRPIVRRIGMANRKAWSRSRSVSCA